MQQGVNVFFIKVHLLILSQQNYKKKWSVNADHQNALSLHRYRWLFLASMLSVA